MRWIDFSARSAIVSVIALAAACGKPANDASATTTKSSGPEPTPAGGSGEVATGNTLTEFQKSRLLGHYSTRDGASGFILDRTVTPWRAKLDGVGKVVTMAETNTPRSGEKEYTAEDKSIWIRVHTESGRVLLFQGPKQTQGVDIVRDADAQQLK